MRFMGIDLGGTSIRAVVTAPDGALLGFGKASGGNPRSSVGEPAENLADAVTVAGQIDVDVVGVGAAGTGSARREEMLDTIRRGLALAGVQAQPVFDTDFGIAFRAAAPAPDGRLLLSGTGAVAAGFQGWAMQRRVDGLGWLLGDTGSGSWIGREVLRAVAASLDGKGPWTRMEAPVLAHFGVAAEDDPCQALVRATDGTRPAQWAEVTPLAMQQSDDPVAARILDEAAAALVATVRAVGDGPVVLAGGVLQAGPLRRRVEAALGECPHAAFPVVGACALAAGAVGATVDRAQLTSALAALETTT